MGVIWDCVIPWPGASNAGWNHPHCFSSLCASQPWHLLHLHDMQKKADKIKAQFWLTVVSSGTLPTMDKQPVSELVRFNLLPVLSNTEKEMVWIFHSHCQNRNSTSSLLSRFSLTSHPEKIKILPCRSQAEDLKDRSMSCVNTSPCHASFQDVVFWLCTQSQISKNKDR